jgi:hypothetical protein
MRKGEVLCISGATEVTCNLLASAAMHDFMANLKSDGNWACLPRLDLCELARLLADDAELLGMLENALLKSIAQKDLGKMR